MMGNKRLIESGKTIVIVLLTISAFYFMNQAALYNGFSVLFSQKEQDAVFFTNNTKYFGVDVSPVRLAVRNETGLYAVQYNREKTDELFENKLGSLLREAMNAVTTQSSILQAEWVDILQNETQWIYYDFASELPLTHLPLWLGSGSSNAVLQGTARSFILTYNNKGNTLYYYDQANETYHACQMRDGLKGQVLDVISKFESNSATFAFSEESYALLNDTVIIADTPPTMPIYETSNPVADWTEEKKDAILKALSFNPKAVTPYQSAEGLVIQEGSDTLRILDQGTVTFHTSSGDAERYLVDDLHEGELVEVTQEILFSLIEKEQTDARVYLIGVISNLDGTTLVSFGYRLHGAPVQVFSDDYCAQFLIQDGAVRDFVIHLRDYKQSAQLLRMLPEQQVSSIIEKKKQIGAEISPVYIDTGEGAQTNVAWMAYR